MAAADLLDSTENHLAGIAGEPGTKIAPEVRPQHARLPDQSVAVETLAALADALEAPERPAPPQPVADQERIVPSRPAASRSPDRARRTRPSGLPPWAQRVGGGRGRAALGGRGHHSHRLVVVAGRAAYTCLAMPRAWCSFVSRWQRRQAPRSSTSRIPPSSAVMISGPASAECRPAGSRVGWSRAPLDLSSQP